MPRGSGRILSPEDTTDKAPSLKRRCSCVLQALLPGPTLLQPRLLEAQGRRGEWDSSGAPGSSGPSSRLGCADLQPGWPRTFSLAVVLVSSALVKEQLLLLRFHLPPSSSTCKVGTEGGSYVLLSRSPIPGFPGAGPTPTPPHTWFRKSRFFSLAADKSLRSLDSRSAASWG